MAQDLYMQVLAAIATVGIVIMIVKRRRAKATAVASVDDIMAAADDEQRRMMAEEVILLDDTDKVLGSGSKKDTHLMVNIDKGMLHRAFSVFMFNQKGELLLQKRSPEKITFPHYWANTCCSHPLFVDGELEEENAMGVKRAAIRKLEQELGITPDQVPIDSFKFLTRVHYKARSDGIWGEHEIDYILICTPPKDPVVKANPNEVAETRWFRPAELREWVNGADARGDSVSPWFRIIERTLLHDWWKAVDARDMKALDQFVDLETIHRAGDFDKKASTTPAGDVDKKQGAYGKVKTHKESILSQLSHLDEVFAALAYKFANRKSKALGPDAHPDDRFCEEILCKVSRSFAAVIQGLPEELRRSIMVFYLVLRGLDTVEDDMEAFDGDKGKKIKELLAFKEHLHEPEWNISGIGLADEARLLREFHRVTATHQRLPEAHREVIEDITAKMAQGMARFINRDLRQGTADKAEYDLYCHYVAGLVGHGLSALFSASGLEDGSLAESKKLSNDMGLFLQKTNIIRDYLEDFVDGRAFWPRDVWSKYAEDLGAFADPDNLDDGLACLNEMVSDALEHAPRCLEYMEQLQNPQVFAFCAVPQVMAIATLDKVYNNSDVFTGVVKIRKGLAVKLMREGSDMQALYRIFLRFSRSVAAQVPASDPNAARTLAAARNLEAYCLARMPVASFEHIVRANWVAVAVFVACVAFLARRFRQWEGMLPRFTDSLDVLALAGVAATALYLLAFCGVPLTNTSLNERAKAGAGTAPLPASVAAY